MYSTRSGLVLAFHGCDESLIPKLLSGKTSLRDSTNNYDWLGHGVYFWEHSPDRAMDFATFLSTLPNNIINPIKKPAVIGTVLNLGYCLDLLNHQNLALLKEAHYVLANSYDALEKELPANKPVKGDEDLILRELDCAVIETLHQIRQQEHMKTYDSVRGVFWEGKELYPNAGFKEKNHIQICIRNPNCIKGYFLPQKENEKFDHV